MSIRQPRAMNIIALPVRRPAAHHHITPHLFREPNNRFLSPLTAQTRTFTMTSPSSSTTTKDWSAAQYLKFGNERTRPVRDLVAQLPPLASASASASAPPPPTRIIDLGCGPGNSTAVLAARYPEARITGVDASPDMLRRARSLGLPANVDFVQADLRTFDPTATTTTAAAAAVPGEEEEKKAPAAAVAADLLFSNAVFHWLRAHERIPTVLRLLRAQAPGGVLAFQVPDNHDEPSHKAMRETALLEGPWTAFFRDLPATGAERPDLDPVETPEAWYDALAPLCERVDIWHGVYQHVLPGPAAIVEWVKATGLMPFLNALPGEDDDGDGVRAAYLAAYEKRLGEVYPPLADGKVMLRYPRLFVVATRK